VAGRFIVFGRSVYPVHGTCARARILSAWLPCVSLPCTGTIAASLQ
jgi:hypothetical protein